MYEAMLIYIGGAISLPFSCLVFSLYAGKVTEEEIRDMLISSLIWPISLILVLLYPILKKYCNKD